MKIERAEAVDVFASVFSEIYASDATEIGTDMSMPRVTKRQINRANVDMANPKSTLDEPFTSQCCTL